MWTLLVVTLLAQSTGFQAQGLKALDSRQYADAEALFSQAVKADPKDYRAHFNLGLAYSMAGKDAQAVPEYKEVLALKPGLYEAELNLGISLLHAESAAAAIPYLQDAVRQKPAAFQPQYYLAEAYLTNNQFPDAEAAYHAALALNANSAPAELGLGRTLAREGRRAEAEPHYRKAAALDPAYSTGLLDLASLYEQNHQINEAMTLYRELPGNDVADEHLGALLLDAGRPAEAIPVLKSALVLAPSDANRLELAEAYDRAKQPTLAEPLAAQAVAGSPNDFDLRMFYGRLLRDQRKFPQAAAQFLAAGQLKPSSVEAWNELSGVYMAAQQYPQALAALDHVHALGAETTAHYFIRALAYDHLHQRQEALDNYEKFLAESRGTNPDQEFQARQRAKLLKRELGKR